MFDRLKRGRLGDSRDELGRIARDEAAVRARLEYVRSRVETQPGTSLDASEPTIATPDSESAAGDERLPEPAAERVAEWLPEGSHEPSPLRTLDDVREVEPPEWPPGPRDEPQIDRARTSAGDAIASERSPWIAIAEAALAYPASQADATLSSSERAPHFSASAWVPRVEQHPRSPSGPALHEPSRVEAVGTGDEADKLLAWQPTPDDQASSVASAPHEPVSWQPALDDQELAAGTSNWETAPEPGRPTEPSESVPNDPGRLRTGSDAEPTARELASKWLPGPLAAHETESAIEGGTASALPGRVSSEWLPDELRAEADQHQSNGSH